MRRLCSETVETKASRVWGIAPTRAIPGPFPLGAGRDRSGNLIFAANFSHQLDKTYNRLRRQNGCKPLISEGNRRAFWASRAAECFPEQNE